MASAAFDPKWSEWDAFELGQYIDSFKSSADRARSVFYIVLTVSLLIATTTWNLNSESWAQLRLQKWAHETLMFPEEPLKQSSTPAERATESKIRHVYLDHYPQNYVSEMVLVNLPLLGISVDVNDFGLLGGITLTLLMALLLLSIRRMDENLYLAIFKIRRLHEEEGRREDGDSRANLLYHALAMGQVFYHPPTLARWRIGRLQGLMQQILRLVLFIPFLVHAWTVLGNARTLYIAVWYRDGGVPVYRLMTQFLLLCLIGTLVVACCWYARASEQRWRHAFFFVNPQHTLMNPTPLWRWLRLTSHWSKAEKTLRAGLAGALGDRETAREAVAKGCSHQMMTLNHVIRWKAQPSKGDCTDASLELMKAARREALLRCRTSGLLYQGLVDWKIVHRTATNQQLEIHIQWCISAAPFATGGTYPSTRAESSLQSARFRTRRARIESRIPTNEPSSSHRRTIRNRPHRR